MQAPTTRRRYRVFEHEPRDLVPVADRERVFTEHSGGEARVKRHHRLGRHALEQPELRTTGNQCHHVEKRTRVSAQRRRARAPRHGRSRGGAPTRPPGPRSRRRGFPPVSCVDRVAVGAARVCELAHRVDREARHRQARDSRCRRELTQDDAQGMVSVDLVIAVRREDQPARLVDPPRPRTRNASSVASSAQSTSSRTTSAGSASSSRSARATVCGSAPPSRSAVSAPPVVAAISPKGTERARRREVLARPTEHRTLHSIRERAHERRLADPRLAADEHKSAALIEGRGKRREHLIPLEKVAHARMFGVLRRAGKCRGAVKIGRATPQSR